MSKNITKKPHKPYIDVYKKNSDTLLYTILYSELEWKLTQTQCEIFGGRCCIVMEIGWRNKSDWSNSSADYDFSMSCISDWEIKKCKPLIRSIFDKIFSVFRKNK